MRRCAWLCVLLFACRGGSLQSSVGAVRVEPATLAFGEVPLQTIAHRTLTLTNTGSAPLDVAAATAEPFAVASPLTLAGGAQATLDVSFFPANLGPATGTLTLSSNGETLALTLIGTGVVPPVCRADACHRVDVNPKTGLCVVTPQPEGSPCEDGCVAGTCRGGVCAGTARACADTDPCTTDGCAAGEGCVHAPVRCEESNPCLAGTCGPNGCASAPVADGTACGSADCVTAQVCIAGACVPRAVPDGSPCGRATACQARGVCVDQQCVAPEPTIVPRAWRYVPPAGKVLSGLVADDAGNSFTLECPFLTGVAPCDVVSFTRDGLQRFRVPLTHVDEGEDARCDAPLILAGNRLVSTRTTRWIDVLDVQTGTTVWSIVLGLISDPFCAAYPGGDDLVLVGALFNTPLIFSVELNAPVVRRAQGPFDVSIAFGRKGGALLTSVGPELSPDMKKVVGHFDALSAVNVPGIDGGTFPQPDGGVRRSFTWDLQWQQSRPLLEDHGRMLTALSGDRALLTHPSALTVVSLPGGAPVALPLPKPIGTPRAVWNATSLFLRAEECITGPCYLPALHVVNPGTRTVRRFALPGADWITPPWLTANDSALLAVKPFGRAAELRALDAAGQSEIACAVELEPTRRPASLPVLSAGRYSLITRTTPGDTALEAWAIPGVEPAHAGWISPRGGPGFDLKER